MHKYLLFIGPGRSGTTYFFNALVKHPDCIFPNIKEGYLYKSRRYFLRWWSNLNTGTTDEVDTRVLVDISNLAYKDNMLAEKLLNLGISPKQIYIVVIVRNFMDRAQSMLHFRQSRAELEAFLSIKQKVKRIENDMLNEQQLESIHELGCHIIYIDFKEMVTAPLQSINKLLQILDCSALEYVPENKVNESMVRRWLLLSLMGKSLAVLMRRLYMLRILQWLKDRPLVKKVFFRKSGKGENLETLTCFDDKILNQRQHEVWEFIKRNTTEVGHGIFINS